jgi:hypothetical protein
LSKKQTTVRIPNDWRPRLYQMPLWKYLWQGGRRAISIWHRRSGKDDVCLHWAAVSAIRKKATYWHMLPEAAQARKAIWEAINPHSGKRRIDEAFPKGIRASTREQEMFIRFESGSTWQVVGSDNFNSLVGSPPFGVVFSEWALADPDAWAYLRPILAENGGWAAFVTTPRGKNHAKTMYDYALTDPRWYAERLPATETKVFTAEQLEYERLEYIAQWGESLGNALFEQEYLCSWEGAWPGKLVYANFNRLNHVAQGPLLWHGGKLYRGWDNTGNSPACVVLQVPTAGQAQVLREYWSDRLGIVDFARDVLQDCSKRYPCAEFDDWADPAGSARFSKPDGGLTSNAELMANEGIIVMASDQALTARIQSVDQAMARQGGLLIDPSCERIIEGFSGGYHYAKITGSEDRFADKPEKNRFSHPHDALQYVIVKLFPPVTRFHTPLDDVSRLPGMVS